MRNAHRVRTQLRKDKRLDVIFVDDYWKTIFTCDSLDSKCRSSTHCNWSRLPHYKCQPPPSKDNTDLDFLKLESKSNWCQETWTTMRTETACWTCSGLVYRSAIQSSRKRTSPIIRWKSHLNSHLADWPYQLRSSRAYWIQFPKNKMRTAD